MWDLALRNIMRNRTRTILTVLGILIGIGSIVALGSIAEGIDASIQSSLQLSTSKITVQQKNAGIFWMGSELTNEDLDVVKSVGGIKDVVPLMVRVENIQAFQGPEYVVVGIEPDKTQYFVNENTKMYQGRELEDGDSGVAVMGKTIADKYNIQVGDSWIIKNEDFEVVGIIEKTDISDIDSAILVTLEDLQNVENKDTYYAIYVIPDDIKDTEKIAAEIDDSSDNLQALTSKELARQASQIVDQIRFFTFGIGAIAAFVGGLGVMNTMIMAVLERRREIGVMKAIGATNRMVLTQILTESALISLIGGLGGIALGLGTSFLLSAGFGGQITPVVTPGLALTGLGFALFLGVIGGLYPARKAAQLDPVEALRYE
ncbi:MAG: ABC transporter permease [Candidatus Aenigmarchaeota archaeon]|nr:ABC transporter permease [Candidatus Aenigmarchaeota archaeon]